MLYFFQAIGAVLIAVILVLVLKQGNPSIGGLLSLLTCAMVMIFAVNHLRPLVDFVGTVERMTLLDSSLLKTLFKVVGISVLAEITELICVDSGNQAMGKALQFVASVLIVSLSVPMMTAFLELIEGILKGL